MDSKAIYPQVIAFDWGNTLMLELPQFTGAMSDWPEVTAVNGAQSMLAVLSTQARLVVASNAVDSDSEKVRAALQRVNLDSYISDIFTSHEISAKKPQPEFFRAIENSLEIKGLFAMVGDSYASDVIGGWQAGWLSIWYNPSGNAAPGLLPVHDLEIKHLPDLPGVLGQLRLPGLIQCQTWLIDQGASANLLLHVQAVSAIAYQMAVWLRGAGETVDPLLAHRGAMLHDLAKVSALRTPGINHGEAAARLLDARGQPALAEIARRHILTHLLDDKLAPRTWEEKVVFFADKMVEGSRLVTPEQRMNALSQRYSRFSAGIQACLPALRKMQKEICQHMRMPEAALTDRLQAALLGKE